MSFVQRELTRIEIALREPQTTKEQYDQLYAAQQALGWALEPTGFRSPYNTIMDIREGLEDYQELPRPLPSSNTRVLDVEL